MQNFKKILENVLFAAPEPLSMEQLIEILEVGDEKGIKELKEVFENLKNEYEERGLQLLKTGEKYQILTQSKYAPWIRKLKMLMPVTLSNEARATLALIAYKQPITKQEIEDIRGVDCESVLNTLQMMKLIKNVGYLSSGAYLYCTTEKFLQTFGLQDIKDLPKV